MTQSMIFYRANCCGNEKNCSYPNRMEVSDVESFRQVVRYDYVCARYRDMEAADRPQITALGIVYVAI